MTKAEISKYMAELGRKNRGRKLSPEKLEAVRANLAKARAKLEGMPRDKYRALMKKRTRKRLTNRQRNGDKK